MPTQLDLSKYLNADQCEAASHIEGPLLVLAGAGSGKTRVVTYRIANLLNLGVPSSEILAVTFTNKAAREMQERVEKLTSAKVWISTFHSLGMRILRESAEVLGLQRGFVIYDQDDSMKLVKACARDLDIPEKRAGAKALRTLISNAKNGILGPDDVTADTAVDEVERVFPEVYAQYQRRLLEAGAVDFDDLLYLPVRLFREAPQVLARYQSRWNFLLVDEYQDTNAAQYELVKMLTANSHNLFVVGDPDQSIYSWRGADINNILSFEQDFAGAKIVRLEENYRSRSNILEAANALIANNSARYEKNLWTQRGAGDKIQLLTCGSDREEADEVVRRIENHYLRDDIPYSEQVVFYRTNFQSRALEDALLRRDIPYVIVGGTSFYQRREIKDILAYLRVAYSGADYVSFARSVNLPKRGLGEKTVEKLQVAASEAQLPLADYCARVVAGENGDGVKMSAKQKKALTDYLEIIQKIRNAASTDDLEETVKVAVEQSGYLGVLELEPDTKEDRRDNLYELQYKASEWAGQAETPSLEGFLEELTLRTSGDEVEESSDRVHLMTIHNGKGLEFDVSFVVGLEEELFPHANSRGDADALEEERRLCYVGMTRAKEKLYLTHTQARHLWGTYRTMRPSRFINEVPLQFLEEQDVNPRQARAKAFDDFAPVSNPENKGLFRVGDAVFHKDFGVGEVLNVANSSLGVTYDVFFSNDNTKRTLVAKYANLTRPTRR